MLLELQREDLCSPQVVLGTSGTSHVASRKSGLLSSCKGCLRIPLESFQGNRASS